MLDYTSLLFNGLLQPIQIKKFPNAVGENEEYKLPGFPVNNKRLSCTAPKPFI
jgi:hypothetical protein